MQEIKDTEQFSTEVLSHEGPVVVDFWAPWCGPCRVALPKLEKMATENPGIKFVKVNVEEAGDITSAHNIKALPTFLVFDGGKEVDRVVADVVQLRTLVDGLGDDS